ncbi:STAS domain-containing protein [Streptomyces sp. NPDC002133]|uniref:STAS domain-containing protein n=1 Tax=Streptomyces sp. NPDC002133 TaxID=3154409 RepID=UPI00331BE58F
MDRTQSPIVLELIGRVTPDHVPLLCASLHAQVVTASATGTETGDVICEVGGLAVADLAAVNAIARLRLTAHRLGRGLRLRNAGAELLALLDFVGLGDDDPEPDAGPEPDRPPALSPRG